MDEAALDPDHPWDDDDRDYVERGRELGHPVSLSAALRDGIPALRTPLINGVLSEKDKMLISGPSKAGKSFALLQLAVAIATGGAWFGFPCVRGRVLYVNLELDHSSCLHRFSKVMEARGVQEIEERYLEVWTLRGHVVTAQELVERLINWLTSEFAFSAVIIDPIYKVMSGDENSARDVATFTNQLDRLTTEAECAVIYCHHHSKGSQGQKRSLDRASGSGVFARDADALIDLIELDAADEPAFRVEGTLRDFPPFKPRYVWFRYPVHVVDDGGALEQLRARGERVARSTATTPKKTPEDYAMETVAAFEAVQIDGTATVTAIAEHLEVAERQARNRIDKAGLSRDRGKVTR